MRTALIAMTMVPALAIAGCATYRDAPIVDAEIVRSDGLAAIGEATRVGTLVVTPQHLVEDSRCPMNARCIWAGRVVVTARIDGAGWRETKNLILGEPVETHGRSLTLTSASPDKQTGVEVAEDEYLFGFEGG